MSGKKSRDKGMRGQREVAQILREAFPEWDPHSGAQYRKGTDNCDVEGTPYWIEVKLGKAPNIRDAMKQAMECTATRPPVAITRADRCEWLATMQLGDWLEIVAELEQVRAERRTVQEMIESAEKQDLDAALEFAKKELN